MKNRTKRIYAILIAVIFGLMTLADPAAVLAQDKGAVNPSQGTDKSQPVKTAPTGDVELNAENFPDEEFREYLKDTYASGGTTLTAEEIEKITEIDVSHIADIKDLTGIAYFTALETLNCSRTSIKNLDVSENRALKELRCSVTEISSLDVEQNTNLETLNCSDCHFLDSLNVKANRKLKTLDCSSTIIRSLDVNSNTNLTRLDCFGNSNLKDLKLQGAINLERLSCSLIEISSLDVSKNGKLQILNCDNTKALKDLKLQGAASLKILTCSGTGIRSLDVSQNKNLEGLYCSETEISRLDVINNTKLNVLDCEACKNITRLDVSRNTALEQLFCSETGISSLNVDQNTKLKMLDCSNCKNLGSIKVNRNTILEDLMCNGTKLSSLDVSQNTQLKTLYCEGCPLAWLSIGTKNNLRDVQIPDAAVNLNLKVTETAFDITEEFPGIDPDKIEIKSGAVLKGNTVSEYQIGTPIRYTYHCGTGINGPIDLKVELNLELIPTYILTVNSGTGSGRYTAGQTVTIKAKPAPSGMKFKNWTVVSGKVKLANAAAATTTFTMPANPVSIRANYETLTCGTPKVKSSYTYRSAKLSWSKVKEAAGYQVYRSASKNGKYKKVKTTKAKSWTNQNLTTGKTYYYKVRAYKKSEKTIYGAFSKATKVVPRTKSPSFKLKAGNNRIKVSWKKVGGADGYRIYRSKTKNGTYKLIRESRSRSRTYTSIHLSDHHRYYYKMRSYKIVKGKKVCSAATIVKSKKTR